MSTNPTDTEKLLEVCNLAAFRASSLLLKMRGRSLSISHKERLDIVTSADLEAERVILQTIREHFPDHNILTEESTQEKTASPFEWIIDPLDGTINYTAGLPMFCVSVAVQHAGVTLAGVVSAPAFGETFGARRECGSHNGLNERLATSKSALSEAVIAVILTSHFSEEHRRQTLDIVRDLAGLTRGIRIIVSEALELSYIACGRLDANICIKADPYGAIAGQLLIEEAGGRVSDLAGASFGEDSTSILASNGVVHDELLELLSKHL
jgi:myo-inositol-1(or 4)-monophosphatase